MHLRTRSGPCVQVLPFSTSSWGKIAQIMFSSVTCSICSPRCQSDLPVNYVQETGWDMRDSWLTSACRWGRTLLWLLQRPPFQTLLGAETWGVLIPGYSRSYFEFVFKCWVIVYQNRIYMAHKTRCVRRLRNKYKWKILHREIETRHVRDWVLVHLPPVCGVQVFSLSQVLLLLHLLYYTGGNTEGRLAKGRQL